MCTVISTTHTVLSITLELEVPTGKVGSSLLLERRRCEPPRGVWGHAPPPQEILKILLDAWKCYFQRFPDSTWALWTMKIKTRYIDHILCLLSVLSSKSQSLAFRKEESDKSSNADSRRVKKRAQQCLPRFLWRGRHFGICESVGLSPVKMSQAFPWPFDLL